MASARSIQSPVRSTSSRWSASATTTTSHAAIAGRLNKVPGVLETHSLIAFRAYSRHDLEAAFSLGAESADPD